MTDYYSYPYAPAQPPTPPEPPRRRNNLIIALAVAVVALLVGLAVVVTLMLTRGDAPRADASAAPSSGSALDDYTRSPHPSPPPSYADEPSENTKDRAFESVVTDAGLTPRYGSVKDLQLLGKGICLAFEAGRFTNLTDAIYFLERSDFAAEDAGTLVGVSIPRYCPDYQSLVQ